MMFKAREMGFQKQGLALFEKVQQDVGEVSLSLWNAFVSVDSLTDVIVAFSALDGNHGRELGSLLEKERRWL
jgi:hypothetical protein